MKNEYIKPEIKLMQLSNASPFLVVSAGENTPPVDPNAPDWSDI